MRYVPDDGILARDLRLAIGRFARRLRQLYTEGDDELSFLELAVLQRLDRAGPLNPGDLAAAESVTSAAIAAVLRSLQQQDLVTRRPDPDDGRRAILAIGPAGEQALRRRDAASVARIRHALDGCDEHERRRLAEVIPLLEKVTAQL